jgi:hypothetical protein
MLSVIMLSVMAPPERLALANLSCLIKYFGVGRKLPE